MLNTPKVVVFDLETTGLFSASGDQIIEIAGIKLDGYHVTGVFQSLINPGFSISRMITKLTGISNEMLVNAPESEFVIKSFVEFVGDHTLAAHNASFDKKFLEKEMSTFGIKKKLDFYCTLINSRKLLKGSDNYKLETLKKYYKFRTIGEAHRALSDSFVTTQLYLMLHNLYSVIIQDDMVKSVESILDKRGNNFYGLL